MFGGFVYIAGESYSPGWSTAKTDMTFIQIDPVAEQVVWAYSLGGSGDDQALVVKGCSSDSKLYALGQGYSVEYTYGTIDIFITRFQSDGTLDYMTNFGGTNPDFGMDLNFFGNRLFVIGHSMSSDLS